MYEADICYQLSWLSPIKIVSSKMDEYGTRREGIGYKNTIDYTEYPITYLLGKFTRLFVKREQIVGYLRQRATIVNEMCSMPTK